MQVSLNILRGEVALLFQVIDTGVGLKGVDYRKLFDPDGTGGTSVSASVSSESVSVSQALCFTLPVLYAHFLSRLGGCYLPSSRRVLCLCRLGDASVAVDGAGPGIVAGP